MRQVHNSIYLRSKRKCDLILTKRARQLIVKLASQVEKPTLDQVINQIGCDLEKSKLIFASIKTKRSQLAKELQGTLPGIRKTPNQGFIYLITNPAFCGWVKCGMTTDCANRLKSYNGYDPRNEFSFAATKPVIDRRKAERSLLQEIALQADLRNGEWFKIDIAKCLAIFEKI